MRSVLAILTSRSQYARVKTLYQSLSADPEISFDLIVAGGALVHRFGNLLDILDDTGIEVTKKINTLIEGGTPVTQAKTTGMGLLEFATTIDEIDPDIVLTTGDRFETMATTIAATYLNVPVAHLEGGELTGSIDDKVRHATTKMSDYHFVSTERSAQIVEAMGESQKRIYNAGCPSIDVCQTIQEEDRAGYDPQTTYGGVGDDIDVMSEYIVVQYHPVPTDYQSNYEKTQQVIEAYEGLDVQAFWFWPNMDAGTDQVSQAIRNYRETENPEGLKFFINLEPHDFLTVLNNSACIVGNSSVGIRESSYFGVPAVNIGDRQQNRERADNVCDVPCESSQIAAGIKNQLQKDTYEQSTLYGDGNAGRYIADVLKELSPKRKRAITPELILDGAKPDQYDE